MDMGWFSEPAPAEFGATVEPLQIAIVWDSTSDRLIARPGQLGVNVVVAEALDVVSGTAAFHQPTVCSDGCWPRSARFVSLPGDIQRSGLHLPLSRESNQDHWQGRRSHSSSLPKDSTMMH